MGQLCEPLRAQIRSNPKVKRNVIVRVQGDLDARAEACAQMGLEVRRKLRLIEGLAVTGIGTEIEDLGQQDWVVSVEEDGTVHTM